MLYPYKSFKSEQQHEILHLTCVEDEEYKCSIGFGESIKDKIHLYIGNLNFLITKEQYKEVIAFFEIIKSIINNNECNEHPVEKFLGYSDYEVIDDGRIEIIFYNNLISSSGLLSYHFFADIVKYLKDNQPK